LSADVLAGCAKLEKRDVDLYLPKFKLEPPTITLAKQFEALGMKTAFDQPKGSANFDKIAPRRPDDYLYISQIFHKTFIAVDEQGTEAAAATAVAMLAGTALRSPSPASDRSESRSTVCLRNSARPQRRLFVFWARD
jgi:serpin B